MQQHAGQFLPTHRLPATACKNSHRELRHQHSPEQHSADKSRLGFAAGELNQTENYTRTAVYLLLFASSLTSFVLVLKS